MQNNYIPQIQPDHLCEALQLCSVRKRDDIYFVAKKDAEGRITEIPFQDIANSSAYEGKPLIRTYSSGHVFIDETRKKVYLITTEKDGKIQHQFTGGGPLELENQEVFYEIDGAIKVHIDKVEENALVRTQNRTGAVVTENYNEIPLVDWVLMGSKDTNTGEEFWKLVCLMHFVVKKYEQTLGFCAGVEGVIGGDWYDIKSLLETKNVAPNAFVVAKKAVELL